MSLECPELFGVFRVLMLKHRIQQFCSSLFKGNSKLRVVFNGPKHKIGLRSSALNWLQESVLVAQWQTEGDLCYITLQIGIERKPKPESRPQQKHNFVLWQMSCHAGIVPSLPGASVVFPLSTWCKPHKNPQDRSQSPSFLSPSLSHSPPNSCSYLHQESFSQMSRGCLLPEHCKDPQLQLLVRSIGSSLFTSPL